MDKETTNLIHIGYVRKAHGIKGQILVSLLSDKIRFKDVIELVWLGPDPDHTNDWIVENYKCDNKNVFLKLRDINTIEEAQYLKNLQVFCNAKILETLPINTYKDFALLSSKNGKRLGKIVEVDYSNIQPAFVVKTDSGKVIQIPAVKDLIDEIHEEESKIVYKEVKGLFDED